MFFTQKTIRWLAVVVGLSLWCGAAHGQYALGDGSGLDNNLDSRSGGRNNAVSNNRIPGQYQNNIVTGNNRGLGNFRGNVGYGAPGEFRGGLGSDEVFEYYRRSTGMGAAASGALRTGYGVDNNRYTGVTSGRSNALSYQTDSGALYRAGAGSTIGNVTGQRPLYGGTGAPGSSNVFGSERFNRSITGGRDFQPDLGQTTRFGTANLARGRDAYGQTINVTASPLGGIAVRRPSAEYHPDLNAYQSGATSRETSLLSPESDEDDAADQPDERLNTVREARLVTNARTDFARQFNARLNPDGTREQPYEAQPSDVDETLDLLIASGTAKPGDDVYFDLLQKLRGEDFAKTQTNQQKPIVPEEPEAGDPAPQPGVTPADYAVDPNEAETSSMEQVIGRINYDLPPLRSLAGAKKSQFNDTMVQAEQYMREGRYFDAEVTYDRALMLRDGYPLALVGKAHAQMGAGLYASASQTLRVLFTRHPELIAARYDQPLVPQEQRIQILRRQLKALAERNPSHRGAPMLLAYLAYQQQRYDQVGEHLDMLAEREPTDGFVNLLRRLWMDAESTGQSTQP